MVIEKGLTYSRKVKENHSNYLPSKEKLPKFEKKIDLSIMKNYRTNFKGYFPVFL